MFNTQSIFYKPHRRHIGSIVDYIQGFYLNYVVCTTYFLLVLFWILMFFKRINFKKIISIAII